MPYNDLSMNAISYKNIYIMFCLCEGESLLKISDDIVRIFTADRDTDEFRAKTLFFHDLTRNGGVSHRARMLDESIKAAKRHGEGGKLGVLDDTLGSIETTLHDEGEGSTIATVHLLVGTFVVGAGLEARIGDTLNLGVLLKEFSDLESVGTVTLHTHSKSTNTTEHKEGIVRAHDATSVSTPLADSSALLSVLGNDNSTDDITVTVDVLGDAVKNDISAQIKRILEDGTGEGVIADKDSTGLMSDLGNLSKIGHSGKRIAGGFDVDNLGLTLADGSTNLLGIGGIDDIGLDAKASKDVTKEVSRRAVHNLGAHGVITSVHEGEDGTSNGGHTRGKSDTGSTVLKLNHSALELLNGRITDTAINVTLTLLAKKISTHLSIIKDESGSLEDGEGVGVHAMSLIRTSSWSLTSVDTLGILSLKRHY